MKFGILAASLSIVGLLETGALAQTPPSAHGAAAEASAPPAAQASSNATHTAPAHKAPASPTAQAEAREHYERGVKLFGEADFEGALVEFQRAYNIAPSYRVFFDIAQCHYQLLNYAEALNNFERFLSEGGEEIMPARRADVEREIVELKGRVAYVTVTVTVPGAEVLVDDRVVGITPLPSAVRVSAGKRRIRVRKTGMVGDERNLELAGSDRTTINLRLVEARTVVQVVGQRRSLVLPVTAAITTGVFAVGTATFGALSLQASNDWQSMRNGSSVSASQAGAAISKTKNLALATDILGGLTAAGVLATGYFFLRGSSTPEGADRPKSAWIPDVNVGPTSADVKFTF